MTRVINWPSRLNEQIEKSRGKAFEWGESDCCTFAMDCVVAITERDPMAQYRGYSTAAEAARIIAEGLPALCDANIGARIPVASAQRGDVVLRFPPEIASVGVAELAEPLPRHADRPSLGICLGAKCAYQGEEGLVFDSIFNASIAWRVE